MTLFEKVGNIKVYTEHHGDGSIEVSFFNGSDLVAKETYFNSKPYNAISDLFSKKLDTYTEEWLWLNCLTDWLEKLSYNIFVFSIPMILFTVDLLISIPLSLPTLKFK